MSSYLGRHFDASLDLSAIGSREDLEDRQIERLSRALATVVVSQTIPRRLGGDATDEELALDKKRARRMAWGIQQALRGWTKRPPTPEVSDEIRRAGAQLNWKTWLESYLVDLNQQIRCVATWALTKGDESWGKSAIVKLENELKWIDYALRD